MSQVRELPHDLLSEKSLIGCLIIDGSSFDDISDIGLKRADFFHPQYGIIFEAISDLASANNPVDYVTVCAKLNERGKLEELGGQSSILELVEEQSSAANVYHYAKIIKEKSSMREIVRTAMKVADAGMNYTGRSEEFFQEVESSFFRLTNEVKTGGMVKLQSCLKLNLKELEDNSRKAGELAGLSTGYRKLDQILLGMQPGQLIVLAARPAMGKTSLALNFAVNSCLASGGLPIAIFSLEMMAAELSMRLLSSRAKIDSKRLKTKDFLDTDLRNIGKAIQELSSLPIYINDSGSVTVLDIMSYCRKIKAEQGLGLIVIDYLQLLKPHGSALSREQQVAEMSRSLKEMAKELQCPVIVLSQLNRQVESRIDKRPGLNDLRESGAIEQDADVVMFVYRDEYYNPDSKEPGVAEVIVDKNRSGETNTAKLAWIGAYTSFENLQWDPGQNE